MPGPVLSEGHWELSKLMLSRREATFLHIHQSSSEHWSYDGTKQANDINACITQFSKLLPPWWSVAEHSE
jgi:hypothetical protein